ncbi:NucA/NucB deoxyribonuclease domain-containing protein [Xenorhabdus griffiniae]|uniref:NucA/NucB deoxyribonuclease domain-containing protein n=2 Tax=Xenorhabdus griffiniae TaxID=351672 RepID=UPI0030D50EAC
MEWVVIENNALASRNLDDCRTLSPEACGKAKELSQRILDKGLPSVEDMRGKLASCQDDSCRKGVWTEYRQASDATINSLKQMALSGELSREELAFINHELGKELAVSGYRANDKIGRSEQSSWLNGGSGPLSGFFNTELRQKELENAGLSKADAAQYVKEEQRNLMLLETATGIIGAKASDKMQEKPSSVPSIKGSIVNKGSSSEQHTNEHKVIVVDKTKYPESAKHIEDAQKAGHPNVLTIDREGAAQRRRESLKNTPPVKGADRDEYPPAMFKEGGSGASVRPITPSDNRGAGSCIGQQCRGLPNGATVIIKTDKSGKIETEK